MNERRIKRCWGSLRSGIATMLLTLVIASGSANARQETPDDGDFTQKRFAAMLANPLLIESERESLQRAFEEHRLALARIDASFNPRIAEAQRGEYDAFAKLWAQRRIAVNAERTRFAGEVIALLGGARKPLWESFDRDERRRRVIPDIAGLIPGRVVSLDVRPMLEACPLTAEQSAEVAPMLAAYEIELDGLLRRVEERWPALTLARCERPDGARLSAIDGEQGALMEACLTPPATTIQSIADALGGETRACVLAQALCGNHPQLCVPSPVEEAMRLLRLCDALMPQQREACEAIFAEHQTRYLAARSRFFEAQMHWDEPRRKQARAERRQELIDAKQRWLEAWADHPGEEALKSMHDMQSATLQRLRSLFDDAQWTVLPPAVRFVLEAI